VKTWSPFGLTTCFKFSGAVCPWRQGAQALRFDVCKRLVTGTDGDVKVCLVQDHKALVICLGCFRRRDPRPYTRDRRRFLLRISQKAVGLTLR
jgi:hypothetical protein